MRLSNRGIQKKARAQSFLRLIRGDECAAHHHFRLARSAPSRAALAQARFHRSVSRLRLQLVRLSLPRIPPRARQFLRRKSTVAKIPARKTILPAHLLRTPHRQEQPLGIFTCKSHPRVLHLSGYSVRRHSLCVDQFCPATVFGILANPEKNRYQGGRLEPNSYRFAFFSSSRAPTIGMGTSLSPSLDFLVARFLGENMQKLWCVRQ